MSIRYVSFRPAVIAAITVASRKAVEAALIEGRNKTVKNLTGTRHGITYKVPGTSRTYTASSPGEFPAIATGELRSSVKYKIGIKHGKAYGVVGTDVEHGLALEKKPASKGGREWLRPSLKQARPKMLAALARRWF